MMPYTIGRAAGTSNPDLGQSASPKMDDSPYYDAKIPSSAGSSSRVVAESPEATTLLWVGGEHYNLFFGVTLNGPIEGGDSWVLDYVQ